MHPSMALATGPGRHFTAVRKWRGPARRGILLPRMARAKRSTPSASHVASASEGVAPPEQNSHGPLDVRGLRAAITHLVGVAAAYELTDDPGKDQESLKLLHDIVKRTRRHMRDRGLKYMMSGTAVIYRRLYEAYVLFRDTPSMSQDELKRAVAEATFGLLSEWQLGKSSLSRDAMKEQGGAAQLAKTVVGEFIAGVSDRQIHTWKERAASASEPSSFGVDVGAPMEAKYFLSAIDLATITGEKTEHEVIINRTLEALDNAVAESQARQEMAIAEMDARKPPSNRVPVPRKSLADTNRGSKKRSPPR